VSVAFCDDAFLPPVTYLAFVAKLPWDVWTSGLWLLKK
jgi:hypothetical protein